MNKPYVVHIIGPSGNICGKPGPLSSSVHADATCWFCIRSAKLGVNTATLRERFDKKWERREGSECWWWTAAVDSDGYGRISVRRRASKANRVAWLLYRGAIPDELGVLHTCDNPLCVNPDHLWLGTPKDNSDDKIRKGRMRTRPRKKLQSA